jgi:hypothetical protein
VFLSTINTQPSTGLANFSVKEKDGASLSNCFRQDSLNAFILRFAGVWRFFVVEQAFQPAGSGDFPVASS